jgi:Fibrobacter succinogenes major domain (Fib_succ_major)
MKNLVLFTTIALVTTLIVKAQKVSEKIGDNSTIIVPSAVLEIESTTKGFLPPRMTFIQRNAIVTPTAGLIIRCTNCGTYGELQVYNGSFWTNLFGEPVQNPWNEVQSSTGRYWMDRNLGASQVATSSDDAFAFGDLFQWGRSADGHQKRSNTRFTNILSNSESPENSSFITITNYTNNNWLTYHNNNLWQGVNGKNNPCPEGFKIPTSSEWADEMNTWNEKNSLGAFTSTLHLPRTNPRSNTTGVIEYFPNQSTYYWSSDIVYSVFPKVLIFTTTTADASTFTSKSYGASIRCIKQ